MGLFFKQGTDKELENFKKGCIVGFYTFLLLLFIEKTYSLFNKTIFSIDFIFWTGLIAAFAWAFILDILAKRKSGHKAQ